MVAYRWCFVGVMMFFSMLLGATGIFPSWRGPNWDETLVFRLIIVFLLMALVLKP